MAKIQSVKFNFIMNSILTMSAMIFPLVTYPYVTGILGPQGIGTVSFANSVVTYFSMFAQLGIPTYGIRACAKVRDNREELSRVTQEILFINLVTCVVSYVLFFASLQAIPQLREEKGLYLVMGTMILFNSIGAEWLYKGLEQYRYITLRSVLFKFIALVGMFLLIHEEGDYVIYGGITIFASVGSNLLNLINLKWLVDVRPVGGYNFRRHLRPIFVFFAMSIATTVYTNMDNVMLGFLRGTTENGYYDAAVKIKNILVSVVASLGTVLLPRVSYYVEQGEKEAFAQATQKALRFVFLLAMPLCLYFILFARPSIYLLSGKAFEASILPMQLIMPTLVLIGLTNIMGSWLFQETRRVWSEERGKISFAEMEKLARDAEPCRFLINPNDSSFVTPGDMPQRIIDFCTKSGQGKVEGDGAVVRAIYDSLALYFRCKLETLGKLLGTKYACLNIVGGGTKDGLLMQLTADALNFPVVAGPVEATAIGNLLAQAMASGEIGSLAEARKVVNGSFEVKTYVPDAERHAFYNTQLDRFEKLAK